MKQYHVVIPPEIEESIRHLHPEVKSKIRTGLEEIEENPETGKCLKDKLEGLKSHRVGVYRIVYEIKRKKQLIQIVDVAKRIIVYERIEQGIRSQNNKPIV